MENLPPELPPGTLVDADVVGAPGSLLRRILSIEFVCGTLFTIIALLMFVEVFTRYVFAYPLTWSDEVVAIAFTWLCFLSSAVAVKHRGHLAVDFLLNKFPVVFRRWVAVGTGLLVIAFLVLLVINGYKIMVLVHHQSSASMALPMSCVYASLPVSAALMLFYELRHVAAALRGGRS